MLATYKHLHENPELSTQEKETSALIAAELKKTGYEVTDHFGQYAESGLNAYGIVAVLKNGPGPVVYVRTDMDALPIVENTGLPYASHVKVARAGGGEVGVMHACGHDLHMTVFLGTARMLAQLKNRWSGTVVLIGQPAEETVGGAQAMLRAGLYTKFPKPDFVLALHDTSAVPAGKVSWHAGPLLAGADSVRDITCARLWRPWRCTTSGKGIPSSSPRKSSWRCKRDCHQPRDGSAASHGGDGWLFSRGHEAQHHSRRSCTLKSDAGVRTIYRSMQREKVLAAITRITNGIAAAAGVPAERAPIVEVAADHVPATINDVALTNRVGASLERALGKENVLAGEPIMASEDFSLFALEDPKPPISMFWLGAADPVKLKDAMEKGTRLPGPHSSEFAPLPDPAIRTGVKAMTSAVMDLLKK